jgi:hypothetical protein
VFEYGPLVFSLPLEAQWKQMKSYAEKSADWQLETKAAWNYGVVASDCETRIATHALGAVAFDARQPALTLQVMGRLLKDWTWNENSAGPLPQSPVHSTSAEQTLTLVPYGSAKLRITAFPFLDENTACAARR